MDSSLKLPHLPAELLSQIFLEVDPHTLYTSIRCLSREWRKQVEENLLKSEFVTNRWRVGLRVTRKAKAGQGWRGGIAGQEGELAPGAAWNRIRSEVEAINQNASEDEVQAAIQRAQEAHIQSVLCRQGAIEDELPTSIQQGEASSALIHVLPLQYKGYDGETAMLQFGTASADWYAMFEGGIEEGENSSRLDLDFSIVWRFPGDGQGDSKSDGWGVPDQENGWLSRFYCSNFDTSTAIVQEDTKVLHTTPLARRSRRRTVTLQPEFHHPELSPSTSTLDWSDEGHEYMSLCLSLGTEFFVRRSAQANFLMRRLETEAEAGEDRRHRQRGGSSSSVSSTVPTPRRDATSSNSSDPRSRSMADPVAKLQGKQSLSATTSSSGANTPSKWSRNGKAPAASYASVASTPVSGSSSPRGLLLPMRLKGLPRIAKIQREMHLQMPPGNRAPFPSTSTSGYSSVKHQSRVQDKEAELYASSIASESLPSSPRQNDAGSSSHGSIPRACFSAQLLVSPSSSPLQWTDNQAGSSSRTVFHSSSSPLTLWEWSR